MFASFLVRGGRYPAHVKSCKKQEEHRTFSSSPISLPAPHLPLIKMTFKLLIHVIVISDSLCV